MPPAYIFISFPARTRGQVSFHISDKSLRIKQLEAAKPKLLPVGATKENVSEAFPQIKQSTVSKAILCLHEISPSVKPNGGHVVCPYPTHPYKTRDASSQPGIHSVSSPPWRLQPSDSVGPVTDGRRSSSRRFHFHRSSRSRHRVNSVIDPAGGSFVAQKGFPRYVRMSWNGSLDSEESRPGSIWEKTEPPPAAAADSRPRARSHSVVGRHRGWLWTSLSHVNSGRSEQLESACSLGIESDGAKLYTISAGTWASGDGA
ncbi:hypothetical protein MUK42_24467 [Musa troglodytarum]|uniref:Uncharacterized protein n=1 Tax=Musa troglodytarum TaxID=320322 RepID=A0A9E7GC04_9LILI|nr:hypothetical protein MUK42_24467 [Musa troglodytarum]